MGQLKQADLDRVDALHQRLKDIISDEDFLSLGRVLGRATNAFVVDNFKSSVLGGPNGVIARETAPNGKLPGRKKK